MKARDIVEERTGYDPNAWMITLSDLLTLMLTFFVLILTASTMDNKRLRETFGFFAGTQGGMEIEGKGATGGIATPFDVRYPHLYILPPGALQVQAFPEIRMAWSKGPGKAGSMKKKGLAEIEKAIRENLEGLGLRKGMDVRRGDEGIVVHLSEDVLFEIGKARIDFQGVLILEKCGEVLAEIPNEVEIRGHTDDLPIVGGKYSTNWELSIARGVNVLRFFTESLGLDARRFSAVGYGKYRPLVPNDSPENRAKNRRAEIVIRSNPRKRTL